MTSVTRKSKVMFIDNDDNVTIHYKDWIFEQDDNLTQVNLDAQVIIAKTFRGDPLKGSKLEIA